MHVTAVVMRRRPLYLHTIVGIPPQEDKYLGWATERIFLPLIKFNLPEVVDYHLPAEGCFHNFCFVSIKKRYPGHAFKVAHALLGLGLLSLEKHVIVFDEWINVHDLRHNQVERGGLPPGVARADKNGSRSKEEDRRDLGQTWYRLTLQCSKRF